MQKGWGKFKVEPNLKNNKKRGGGEMRRENKGKSKL
jgi:hypothetical protein